MIRLLCYEPAGQVLQLSTDDLTRHVLGLGATGCGKTTGLINPLIQQLIGWRSAESERKPGLLVLDPKEDDTPDRVREYAREAGRLDDVVILSTRGNAYYGYFTGLKRLDQIDEFTRRILYGTQDMGDQNAYWTESRFGLVNAALTMLLAGGQSLTFDRVAEFLRDWFYSNDGQLIKESVQFLERLLALEQLRPATRRRLQLAVLEAQNWQALDQRTRELHKSTLNNALRTLLSPAARDLFDESKQVRFDPADVLAGKVLVASLNAVCHPQLTAMLFKALKRDYYEAVLSRVAFDPDRERLCGLVLDEFPLSVMPEDAESLGLLRSKGGAVVACSQGISALDDALGPRKRAALLANFNSVFYFASREDQTDAHALLTLGFRDPSPGMASNDSGHIQLVEGVPPQPSSPICPPGTLARLSQHHAFVKLASGTVTPMPVWLAAKFHQFPPAPPPQETDDLVEAAASLRLADEQRASLSADVCLFLTYMHRRKHPVKLTPSIVAAAWQLCVPKFRRHRVLDRLGCRIQGIGALPRCWLVGLDRWLRRYPLLAPMITEVKVTCGVLWVELDRAARQWGDGPLNIPEAINLLIYPSLWRPLQPRHLGRLLVDRPDLREELRALPQLSPQDENF